MNDEELIQDLELQIRWVENHLFPGWQNVTMGIQRAIDRLQPVLPVVDTRSAISYKRCGYCNEPVEKFAKYCWNCGRGIKWE